MVSVQAAFSTARNELVRHLALSLVFAQVALPVLGAVAAAVRGKKRSRTVSTIRSVLPMPKCEHADITGFKAK